ncbi:ATP-binding protein [Candidatus Binatus sp.]|uniref:ATP-binding protein n=1 Tax=Candidatus Binatus sp. TaxID=2811406 RepID=UPI003C8761A1
MGTNESELSLKAASFAASFSASFAAPGAWADVNPHSHLVQFYEDDGFLIDSLTHWFADGLSVGDSCVYVGTDSHRISLEQRLAAQGVDLDKLRKEGRFVCRDASQTLSTFMVDEWPDEPLFTRAIESVIACVTKPRDLRVFGEMVALLWADGNRQAAVRLEEMWNTFMKTHALSLCCAYPLHSFGSDADASLFLKVCANHTPVLPAESYSALPTEAERFRAISLLQQKARVLDAEKAGRKEAEKSLHLRQKELSDFIENALEGLHQVGPDGKILWANPAQLKLLGYSAAEYIGRHLSDFYVERNRFDEFWNRLMRGEVIYDFQAALRCKDGSIKHVLIHSSGRWVDSRFVYTRCFIRDVTERVELERELKVRLAELAQADQRKNEFLAMLGHELRNPLSAVLDAIATAQLDHSRRDRALIIARRQTDQLAGLVDDLLDVGRITQGRIALKKEAIKVGSIVKQAVEEAQCLVEPGQHQLSVRISSVADEAMIEADPARMRQVITNLMHNAAKFTPPGGRIDVLAERTDQEVVLRVCDSGIGISRDLLPHVFDLFTQAERPLDRSHGGLGIGLTLVKRLVEMHGGSVQAHSAGPGMGSEFEVRLPVSATARPQTNATAIDSKAQGDLRVVIVEDNYDAAEALTMLIELFGHQATIVADGLAAIDAVRDDSFDIGLVDIGLPGIDGYEVARRIRMLPNAKTMKLVALTGYGQETDKQRALSAGFDEHLTKPVKIERLQALLNRPR